MKKIKKIDLFLIINNYYIHECKYKNEAKF